MLIRNFTSYGEKGTKLSLKGNHDYVVDEIALRDEILELKRQVVILKRTNEQNLIKFRKYEDEAKRKDRQIEELMDPGKNSDITKFLSIKGAAILMNLKDQNNSLIQMVLNKDLQIRRLVAELKTSKLYGPSKKTENYRTEINRLRNLLEKSRESLKESIDLQQQQQQQQQEKLFCINGISNMQTSCSSEQSSPRELEDLRFAIQSLEAHIKYSNDLLAKKNLEILALIEELNSFRKISQCKTCYKISKSNQMNGDFQFIDDKIENLKSPNSYGLTSTIKSEKTIYNSENQKVEKQFSEIFKKTMRLAEDTKKSNSAPASSLRCSSFSEQDFDNHENMNNSDEKRSDFKNEDEIFVRKFNPEENDGKINEKKILFEKFSPDDGDNDYNATNKIQTEEKKTSRKKKEKRINSFVSTKQLKKKSARKNSAIYKKARKKIQLQRSKKKDKILDLESKKIKKVIQVGNYEEKGKGFKETESDKMSCRTFVKVEVSKELKSSNNDSLNYVSQEKLEEKSYHSKMVQSSKNNCKTLLVDHHELTNKCLESNVKEKMEKAKKEAENDSTTFIKKEIANISNNFSPEIQRELKNLYENITIYEEIEMKKVKTRREIYEQNFDSSFDSDNGYSLKQQPQSVQVEVEINSLPLPHENFQFTKTPIKNINLVESLSVGTNIQENYFSDDDDVIIR